MRRRPSGLLGIVPGLAAALFTVSSAIAQPLVTPMAEAGHAGGRFAMLVTGDPRTFNPLLAAESNSVEVCERLFTSLAELDRITQEYRPALATKWEMSKDRRTCTWRLRRGARFSDGHPISSEDVVFSFRAAYDTALATPLRDGLLVHGKPIEVSAPDSYTVVTRISEPYGLLVPAVASLRIVPRHVLEPLWRAGRLGTAYSVATPPESLVTSGPFRLVRYAAREQTVLGRNPQWFGVDAGGRRLPYLDDLVLVTVSDQNAAALKFLAGEVDALDNVRPEDFPEFEKRQSEGFTLVNLGPSLTSNFFWFNLNRDRAGQPRAGTAPYAWFSNRELRRAVSRAIDRDAIIRGVYFGHAAPNWSVITAGNTVFHVPAAAPPDHDPAAARSALDRLGFTDKNGDGVREDAAGNALEVMLKTNANSNVRVQMANLVREDLAAIGIRCTVTPVDFATMMANVQNDHDYQLMLGGLGTTVPPDPGLGANYYLSSGATHFWNAGQDRPGTPAEARIDSLFQKLQAADPIAERRRLAAEIDRIVLDESWVVWLPVPEVRAAVRNRFGNLRPAAIRPRLLWNAEILFVKDATAAK